MGRRANIVSNIFLFVIAGTNVYLNWLNWSLQRGARSDFGQIAIFNMVLMLMLALISLGQLWKLLTAPRAERILDPHSTLVVEESLIVRICRALALSFMIFAGVWAFTADGSPMASLALLPVMGVIIISIGVFSMARLVFNPRQRLVLTPQSLTHSQVRPAVIAWEEIADVQSKSFLTTKKITLQLRGSREFRPASPLARWRRVETVVLNPITFGVDPDILKRGIDVRRNVFTF
jgi:hypothetical protein